MAKNTLSFGRLLQPYFANGFKKSLLSIWLLPCLLTVPTFGYATITIVPSQPTSTDFIQVTISGDFSDPCFDISSSYTINENAIVVSVHIVPVGEVCVQVIASWSVTEAVGQLPPGGYEVTAIIDAPCCFPCNPPPCMEHATFQVAPLLGDVNQDSRLTPADALCIFRRFLELPSCLDALSDLEPFKTLARSGVCANRRNQLFLIDNAMVLWLREGDCSDAMFSYRLYGRTVDELLCAREDSIAGPREFCIDESRRNLFDTIVSNLDQPDFGLDDSQVREIPF